MSDFVELYRDYIVELCRVVSICVKLCQVVSSCVGSCRFPSCMSCITAQCSLIAVDGRCGERSTDDSSDSRQDPRHSMEVVHSARVVDPQFVSEERLHGKNTHNIMYNCLIL